MTKNTTPITTLFEQAEEYSKTSLKLFRLNAIDKTADIASSLVSRLVVIMTVVFSVLLGSIGVALWIGKLLGEAFYGYFTVGAFYLFLAIFLHLFRNQCLKYPVSNAIIKKLLKEKIV